MFEIWGEGTLSAANRREENNLLRRKLERGELEQLDFDAVVFREGRNGNFARFRREDLASFAASFVGVPFLRNHGVEDIGNRDGTVQASAMEGPEMRQRIRLTTRRGMKDFLEGIIDRFSIGWYFEDVECTVCGRSWMECPHAPGRRYEGRVCELLFVAPRGKETSAVNAPAVEGTHVLAQLTRLKQKGGSGGPEGAPAVGSREHFSSGAFQNKEERMTQGVEILLPNGEAHTVTPGQAGGERVAELEAALHAERAERLIERSGLSAAGQAAVRSQMQGASLEQIGALITSMRGVEAEAANRGLVQGVRPLHIAEGSRRSHKDALQGALDWMLGLRGQAMPEPSLRDIRDVYQAITGDHNWYGVFNPQYAQLAEATTTTLAGMVVDSINRVVRMHYDNMLTYRWYEPIVDVVAHSGSTHNIELITVDGLANLPTVAEGASYTEASVGDALETISFAKRGQYVGITLETIRRSELMRLQAIPRELIKAAIRARSAAISSIFTQNSGTGPTLAQDATVLFHSNHGNVATTAFDATGWAAMRTALFEQSVPGASKGLGLWPRYALVPIELYDTALTLFGYGSGDVGKPNSGGTAQEVNPYADARPGDPRPIPIAVPEWTDANDWAAIVDPRQHPVIHIAYANAPQGGTHPLPEIFQVTSESQGLMFSNDTLPVKARDWWAYGVSTYIGIAKRNVT